MTLKEMRQTRICGEQNLEWNDPMLHYEQVFDNAFESRESKYCKIKYKGKQVITLQMTQ